MTLAQPRAAERQTILDIAPRHGVTAIKVFGSFVRGEVCPDSDLDLPIEAGVHTSRHFSRMV
jgi:predicted nucleotidyltransferase